MREGEEEEKHGGANDRESRKRGGSGWECQAPLLDFPSVVRVEVVGGEEDAIGSGGGVVVWEGRSVVYLPRNLAQRPPQSLQVA